MTGEQTAIIAAATALSSSRPFARMPPSDVDGLADAIGTLARSLYPELREQSAQREQEDLLERLGQLSDRPDS